MNEPLPHADDASLRELVFGEDDSPTWSEAATHVESCDVCLDRLHHISGAHDFESEAAELLSSYPIEADEISSSESARATGTESLEGLDPPNHPEMLGRIGRYDVERRIGAGGMGVVLKGFDTELNRPVAIKILARHLAHSGAARQRFAREAKAAAAVVHEHVVAIHNVETDGAFPFIVMQYVAGESLQAQVDRDGPLDTRQILRIGIQAAAGLAAAHEQGVVHRDVKPANILMASGVERILLTDFGLARTVDDASLTHTGVITGTPQYMSPEQASGEASDHRTDLFSLGSVLYFTATGHPPFRAERAMGVLHRICSHPHRPVWQVNSDVSDELSDVIDDLLCKKPSRRIQSAAELRDILVNLLERIQQPRPWWRRRLRRFAKGWKPLVAAGCVAATLAAVLGVAALSLRAVAVGSKAAAAVETGQTREESGPAGSAHNAASAQDSGLTSDAGTPSTTLVNSGTTAESSDSLRQLMKSLNESTADAHKRMNELEADAQRSFVNPVAADWYESAAELNNRLDELESPGISLPEMQNNHSWMGDE